MTLSRRCRPLGPQEQRAATMPSSISTRRSRRLAARATRPGRSRPTSGSATTASPPRSQPPPAAQPTKSANERPPEWPPAASPPQKKSQRSSRFSPPPAPATSPAQLRHRRRTHQDQVTAPRSQMMRATFGATLAPNGAGERQLTDRKGPQMRKIGRCRRTRHHT
jgi:hypothetical protein